MASSIPKFASFRPKPKPGPEAPEETDKSQDIPSRFNEHAKRERSSQSGPKHSSSSSVFFSDRRGDPEILRYETVNRYEVPAYRRSGYGFVLGLSSNEKIDRELSTEKRIYTTPLIRPRQERLLTNKHLNKSNDRNLQRIRPEEHQVDLNPDFVSVLGASERRETAGGDHDETGPDLDYRGFNEEHGPDQPVDLDIFFETEIQTSISDKEVTRKNSELLRSTREHPEGLQSWLAFIDHQEAMLKLDRSSDDLSASDKQHLADVRIAIYEEALKRMSKNQLNQGELYKGLFKEARKTWDGIKLANKWKEAILKHPNDVGLWFMFLDFEQSSFARFKFEHCRSTFLSCLQNLCTISGGITPEQTLHILLRLTSMIHESGYQELSLAVWQALLEFHLLRPLSALEASLEDNLGVFEEFWESEGPRIGESKAKGWKLYSVDEPPPSALPNFEKPDLSDHGLEFFQKYEMEAVAKLRYPGRASDDTADDDAFHVIFFSDIEVYLKTLPIGTPSPLIIDAFLCFCGLPQLPQKTLHHQSWRLDPFLLRQLSARSLTRGEESSFKRTLQHLSDCPIKGFRTTSELLFDQDFSLESIRLSPEFVRRVLKLLALNDSNYEAVGEYLLAFELCHFPNDVHKTAKLLLKSHPSSLRLYNSYGLVESRRGNLAKADQVFSMALSMQAEAAPISTRESIELLSNWVWAALDKGEQVEALWRLASSRGSVPERTSGKAQPSEEVLVRSRSRLRDTSERSLLNQDHLTAVISTSLLTLLTYLEKDFDAVAAYTTYQHLSTWFTSNKLSKSPWAELHAQLFARLLSYHVSHASIVKPALLRTILSPLVSQFSGNTMLLSLYAANEARFSIEDRVRSTMRQSALQNADTTSVVAWAFAIYYEMVRGQIAGSTSHSIRALFKRAADSTGAHCPAIWKLYLQFELAQLQAQQDKQPKDKSRKSRERTKWENRIKEGKQRIKDMFYIAIRNMPWCKDFIMMAFTDAQEVFEEDELWRLHRILQEKELRLYVEVDGKDI